MSTSNRRPYLTQFVTVISLVATIVSLVLTVAYLGASVGELRTKIANNERRIEKLEADAAPRREVELQLSAVKQLLENIEKKTDKLRTQ